MRHLKPLGQYGDTIVEVMVVLAVLGLAVSISYTTANRSLLDAQQAQENAQATEFLQSQIEILRTQAATTNVFITGPQLFCFAADKSIALTNVLTPVAACKYNNLYDVSILYTGSRFDFTATWPDVQGDGNDTITLSYRYYQL